MRYSINDVKSALTSDNKNDSLWVRVVVRNISFPISVLFLNAGSSAWAVSMLSVLFAFLGCGLLMFNNEVARWCGIICSHIWMLLDCVDGNVARVRRTQGPKGEFIDALSGYVMSAFCYVAVGMTAYYTSRFDINNREIFIVLGAIAAICNVLPRLIHQKYEVLKSRIEGISKNCEAESSSGNSKLNTSLFNKWRNRIGKEIGLSGLFMPMIVLCQIIRIYDIMIIFYAVFCILSTLIVIGKYSMMTK